jgi:hypothetical protein
MLFFFATNFKQQHLYTVVLSFSHSLIISEDLNRIRLAVILRATQNSFEY